jgi:hypothetical protein
MTDGSVIDYPVRDLNERIWNYIEKPDAGIGYPYEFVINILLDRLDEKNDIDSFAVEKMVADAITNALKIAETKIDNGNDGTTN